MADYLTDYPAVIIRGIILIGVRNVTPRTNTNNGIRSRQGAARDPADSILIRLSQSLSLPPSSSWLLIGTVGNPGASHVTSSRALAFLTIISRHRWR